MRYLGTICDLGHVVEVYRLSSSDLHPEIKIVEHTCYPRSTYVSLPARATSLGMAQTHLIGRLMMLFVDYIMVKRENMIASPTDKKGSSGAQTKEQQKQNVSEAIAIPIFPIDGNDNDLNDLTMPRLILFEDEIEMICKSIEVAMRPVIFRYMQLHKEVDWQLGRNIFLSMRVSRDLNAMFDERDRDQAPERYKVLLGSMRERGDYVMRNFIISDTGHEYPAAPLEE
ncbi:hypothetical protein IFR05_014237 [Cadophora sp. M221]|nr:hypothetical protein IFR05_014237 [Cadophora sp. M221]